MIFGCVWKWAIAIFPFSKKNQFWRWDDGASMEQYPVVGCYGTCLWDRLLDKFFLRQPATKIGIAPNSLLSDFLSTIDGEDVTWCNQHICRQYHASLARTGYWVNSQSPGGLTGFLWLPHNCSEKNIIFRGYSLFSRFQKMPLSYILPIKTSTIWYCSKDPDEFTISCPEYRQCPAGFQLAICHSSWINTYTRTYIMTYVLLFFFMVHVLCGKANESSIPTLQLHPLPLSCRLRSKYLGEVLMLAARKLDWRNLKLEAKKLYSFYESSNDQVLVILNRKIGPHIVYINCTCEPCVNVMWCNWCNVMSCNVM